MSKSERIKILFLGANPTGTGRLALDKEFRGIRERLLMSALRDDFELASAWAVRTGDLRQELLTHAPSIVHFAGHGTPDGLILEGAQGTAPQRVSGASLAALFGLFRSQVRCVVLNACYSEDQAIGIAQAIPVVVGMRGQVDDRAAILFADGLYQAIAHGRAVSDAVLLGQAAYELEGITVTAAPKIRTRPDSDAATLVLRSSLLLSPVNAAPAEPNLGRKSNLPPRRHDFISRTTELAELHRLMTQATASPPGQGAVAPCAIIGMGGVGKSTLAAEYAYRHLGEYEKICWVNADDTAIKESFASLAANPLALDLPSKCETPRKIQAVLARLERGGPHLLILDNITTPESYASLLPQTAQVQVLMTTRRTDLHGIKPIKLDVLSESDALYLMLRNRQLVPTEYHAATELCRELGYLTLAVAIAGRLLETNLRTPSGLLTYLQAKGPLALPLTQRTKDVLGATPSLIRLFDASIDLLQEINPVDAHARRLFWVGGWFAPMAIPQDVILDAASCLGSVTTDQAQAIASLERLLDLGLTSIDDQGRPTFHRLVAAYARYRSGEPAAIAVLDALGTAASSNMAQTGDIFQMYLTAHMSSVWMYRQGASPKQHLAEQGKYMQYCAFGKFAAKQRQWDDSIHFYSHALSIAEKTNGHRSSETANLLYAIGQALASKGSHVEALRYLGRNLLIAEKLYGAEHPITATTMKTIGQVLLGQGKQAEAQPYFQHHRAIKEKTLGTPASHERLKPVVSGLSIILGYEHPDIIELESWLK